MGGDIVSTVGIFTLNPWVFLAGYCVSATGSFGGLSLTGYKMSQGRSDFLDLSISFGTFVGGFAPGLWGVGIAGFQTAWDIWRK